MKTLLTLLLLFLASPVWAGTYNCTGTNDHTGINNAITAAAAGETIYVHGTSCVLGGTITLNKAVALIGDGIGLTTITRSSGSSITITDGTNDWRISGFTFTAPSNNYSGGYAITGGVANSGGSGFTRFRIDHNRFNYYHYATYIIGPSIRGVYDSNIIADGMIWLEGNDLVSWQQDTDLGTDNFIFVENNIFTNQVVPNGHSITGKFGSRMVFRYNDIEDPIGGTPDRIPDPVDQHGFCHGSANQGRGARAYEIYNNKWHRYLIGATDSCCRGMYIRSGTGVIYNNYFDHVPGFAEYNYSYSSYDGPAPWDSAGYSEIYFTDSRLAEGAKSIGETYGTDMWCPGTCQIGTGKIISGRTQTSEPVYLWNNTRSFDAGVSDGNYVVSPKKHAHTTTYIVQDRDYILSTKPGYTAYRCPHELTGLPVGCNSTVAGTAGYNVAVAPVLGGVTEFGVSRQ
jgi:hypothetical protein